MRKRGLLALVIFTCLAVPVGFWEALAFFQPQINRASYEKIQEGMAFEDVANIVRTPPGDYSSPDTISWLETVSPEFIIYPGFENTKDHKGWKGHDVFIVVGLDRENKVTFKQIRELPGENRIYFKWEYPFFEFRRYTLD